MKVSSLKKRSWSPYIDKKTGKWYTGYAGSYHWNNVECVDIKHEVRTLTLTPIRISRGRSAANMIFEDKAGYPYVISLGGGFELIKRLLRDEIKRDGEFMTVDFVQTKKGANIFIEAVEYE